MTRSVRLAAALRRDGLLLARRMAGSIQALGLDVFDGAQRPTAWLAGSAQHSGLPPSTAGSGAFGFLLQLLGHSHGWPFPAGGQGALTDALVAIAQREGVTLRCNAHVESIEVRAGRVAGVRLRAARLAARDVLTTISARPLLAMLPDDALPHRLMRRLRIWRYGTAAFKIDYALRAPVPWTAAEPRAAAVVHVGGDLVALAGAAESGGRGEVPEQPALVIGQHTLYDSSRAPEGQHTLYCYAHVPARYDCPDEEIVGPDRGPAGALCARLRRHRPGPVGAQPGPDRGREPEPRRRRPRRRLDGARPAAAVPSRARALPLPDAAARPVRDRGLGAPGRIGSGHGRALGGAGPAA